MVGKPLNGRRHLSGSLLLDDFARNDDVVGCTAPSDDVSARESTEQTQTDDVSTGTRPPTTQSGDVSTGRVDDDDDDAERPLARSPVAADCRSSLPPFEPRPAAAYGRHSSRMFFYDRLRSTHDCNVAEHPAKLND